ncbi:MAG TPA: 50S ribosome-binding GTPase, partial [Elusimicrobiota bacterium]|nr:50S ribosome-binding GTPase [Elusimicrobiota bacterium]
ESFRRLAMEQMQGRLSVYLKDLRRRLVDLLALLEANLDFAEDEVPDLSKDDLRAGLDRLLQEGTALLHTASRGRLLRDGLRAVLVGSPNVGKSSLFNALLGHDRAIVTEVPGTTRDTLEERFLADDVPVTVTDTAGLRTETDRVEGAGIARAKRALEQADVALFVLDASRPLSEEDRAVAALLDGKKIVLALNKWDRAGKETAHHLRAPLPLPPKTPCLKTCALDGRGVNELRRELVRVMDDRSPETADVPTLINLRHAELLNDAVNHLKAARRSAESSLHEECLAIDMRLALGGLNQITGEGVHDEILDAIFSKFCVGK